MSDLEPARPTVAEVREIPTEAPPALIHPGWAEALPWLVQGTTTRGATSDPFDLGLFSEGSPEAEVRRRFDRLRTTTGMDAVVHARQVHGAGIHEHGPPSPREPEEMPLRLVEPCDGHLTREPGLLLAVTAADCVPVFLADPPGRAIALVHAGWRGVAAGILEAAVAALVGETGSGPESLWLHLGPSICGACYEVGPEVFEAVGQPAPRRPRPIDLRAVLSERALAVGLAAERVSISTHCTLCTGSRLFSHRGGDAHRHVGYLGIRPDGSVGA